MFTGDDRDQELKKLSPFLERLAQLPDVRPVNTNLIFFNSGREFPVPKTTQKPGGKGRLRGFLNKLINILSCNVSEIDENPEVRNRALITTMYTRPKNCSNFSASSLLRTTRDLKVVKEKLKKLTTFGTQYGSPISTRMTENIVEESNADLPTPNFWRRSVHHAGDETDYSNYMDETLEGMPRRNRVLPSLSMGRRCSMLTFSTGGI